MAARRRRHGWTLIELLVVIAIISILLLLLLPAVNAVREMGRRTQCINNQRSVAMAMINYESVHLAFPAAVPLCDPHVFQSLGRETGVSCLGPNWAAILLDLLDEKPLSDSLDRCLVTQWHASDDCGVQSGNLGQWTPSFLICPSAPQVLHPHSSSRTQLDQLSKGNYAACLGAGRYRNAIDLGPRSATDAVGAGVMIVTPIDNYVQLTRMTRSGQIGGEWKLAHGQGLPSAKVTDGLSHTIVLSELLPWDGVDEGATTSSDLRGVWVSPSMGASTYTHRFGPNSGESDRINGCDSSIPRDNPLACLQAPVTGEDAAETWASAQGAHRGGVVAAAADGSVKFYADDIFLSVWQALATRSGDER